MNYNSFAWYLISSLCGSCLLAQLSLSLLYMNLLSSQMGSIRFYVCSALHAVCPPLKFCFPGLTCPDPIHLSESNSYVIFLFTWPYFFLLWAYPNNFVSPFNLSIRSTLNYRYLCTCVCYEINA